MADTSTVGLDLDGNFESVALSAAQAALKLAVGLDNVSIAAGKLKMPALVSESSRLKALAADADAAAAALKAAAADATRAMDQIRSAAEAAERAVERLFNKSDKRKSNKFDEAMKAAMSGAKTPEALTPKTSTIVDPMKNALGAIFGTVGKVFGPGAATGLRDGAAKLAGAAEKLEPVMPLLKSAGGLLMGAGSAIASGGAIILGAAAALAAAGAGLVAVGLKFGIETTDKKQVQDAIFNKVGGKYDVAIDLAAKYGIDTDTAVSEVKKLLGAKFDQTSIDEIVRVSVGIGAVEGEEKAKAFVEKMTQQANKGGNASEETVKGFAEAGVSADHVYAELAKKMGISTDQAKAKVKSGAVGMKDALDAVKNAAGKDFGGVADTMGASIFAGLNKIKIAFTKLFGGFDLGPIKSVLKNISDVLNGPAGKGMGEAFTKLGNTLIKTLFGPLEGDTGKAKLEKVAAVITKIVNGITRAIVAVTPYVSAAAKFLGELFSPPKKDSTGPLKTLASLLNIIMVPARILGTVFRALYAPIGFVVDKLGGLGTVLKIVAIPARILGTVIGALVTPITEGINALSALIDMFGETGDGASDCGTSIVDGIVNGITSGASAAVAAASALASSVLATVKGVLGVASPSKAMMFVGDMMGEGMSKGMNDNASPAAAGEKMAGKAAKGAGKGAAGGGAGAGGGGDGLTIIVQVTAAPGMGAAETKAIGDQIGEASYAAFQRNKRRDAREAGGRR